MGSKTGVKKPCSIKDQIVNVYFSFWGLNTVFVAYSSFCFLFDLILQPFRNRKTFLNFKDPTKTGYQPNLACGLELLTPAVQG